MTSERARFTAILVPFLLMHLAGCSAPAYNCKTGLPSDMLEGYWHQSGLFSQAVQTYRTASPTPSWYLSLDAQTGKAVRLPFEDSNITMLFHGAVALGGVEYWSGKTQFLVFREDEGVAINAFHYDAGAESDGRVFLQGIARLNATRTAEVEQALFNSPEHFWAGKLDLRLTELFHQLHPVVDVGDAPRVDPPWRFNFKVDFIDGSATVDGISAQFQLHGWDSALVDFTPQTDQARFRPLAEHLFSQLHLPAPTFEGLDFVTPC